MEGQGTVKILPGDGGTGRCHYCALHTACYHRLANLETAPSLYLIGTVRGEQFWHLLRLERADG